MLKLSRVSASQRAIFFPLQKEITLRTQRIFLSLSFFFFKLYYLLLLLYCPHENKSVKDPCHKVLYIVLVCNKMSTADAFWEIGLDLACFQWRKSYFVALFICVEWCLLIVYSVVFVSMSSVEFQWPRVSWLSWKHTRKYCWDVEEWVFEELDSSWRCNHDLTELQESELQLIKRASWWDPIGSSSEG